MAHDRYHLSRGRTRWLIYDRVHDGSLDSDDASVIVRDPELAMKLADFLNRQERERNVA